ncbi:hypothetical protein Z043_116507 [Scleropages formosus]|uniref:RING-type E3 ubiquitin transferase n=1 Tax=Scleropages formosus TaxID=113540 RepID=A0A0N8JXZ3_SCLFO|nr:hypothetical protein Z043_116507 [Scleropages formosus]
MVCSGRQAGRPTDRPTDWLRSFPPLRFAPPPQPYPQPSLPVTPATPAQGFKCPVCSKSIASNEMEPLFSELRRCRVCIQRCGLYSLLCRVDDVLARDAGECVICLEELQQGDTIARLPCLCIYHKR